MRFGITAALLCIAGFLARGAGSRAKGYVVTFHLEGQVEETDKFVTPVKLGSEHRQYYFRKMPAFSDKDIAWFYPFVAQDGSSFGAAFRLNDHKAKELNGLTIANHGKLFGTRVLDAPLRAVIIDQPVNDGVLVIWDGLSKNHVQQIGSKIAHVDKVLGTETPQALPTFNVPQTSNQSRQNPASNEGDKKKPFKLFGNANRKKVDIPTNPYVNLPD
jgi:hypothetical protein